MTVILLPRACRISTQQRLRSAGTALQSVDTQERLAVSTAKTTATDKNADGGQQIWLTNRRMFGRRKYSMRGGSSGTLMRHFILLTALPVAVLSLPGGVAGTTVMAVLITLTGSANGSASGRLGTMWTAVTMTVIAVTANDHLAVATSTIEDPGRMSHRLFGQ